MLNIPLCYIGLSTVNTTDLYCYEFILRLKINNTNYLCWQYLILYNTDYTEVLGVNILQYIYWMHSTAYICCKSWVL